MKKTEDKNVSLYFYFLKKIRVVDVATTLINKCIKIQVGLFFNE
jgi:hypothetical protein